MDKIHILKSKRRLTCTRNNQLILDTHVGIGKETIGTKIQEGDCRTPEGAYQICVKNPHSRYYLSLGLNYPNLADAQRGLDNQLITLAQFEAIKAAHANQTLPPWNTPLGGEIYLHGHLENKAWSEGCIRLNQHDMKILYDAAFVGLPVTIEP